MESVSLLALALALSAPPADDVKKELEALKGKWTAVSYEIGGGKIEGDALKEVLETLTFKGDAYEWKTNDDVDKGKLKLDPSKDPKHLDFESEPAAGVKVTAWTGIYSVKDDTLRICVGPGAGTRPKDFSTTSVTYGVFTLKRAK
jgi:uncharacterized protein (TIGR03067 family)